MSLKGQVALVTGGGKNLGALVAQNLAAEGAHLALHYNSASSKMSAEEVANDLSSKYPDTKVKLYQGDLTSTTNVQQLFSQAIEDLGQLDIVVNTVGMGEVSQEHPMCRHADRSSPEEGTHGDL